MRGEGSGLETEMSSIKQEPPILCIVGPTASGKTLLAIEIAKKLNGEIVNADSRQIYRELNIGTAKPSKKDQQEIPHHLIDCASINSPWSAAQYAKEASKVIADISRRNHLPIVVGGTGLYVKSLLFGLDEIEQVSSSINEQLDEALETKGLSFLYEELKRVDPVSAGRLKPADIQRILRALAVYRQTGKPIHEFWDKTKKQSPYNYLKIGLDCDRAELYRRIDARVLSMMEQGLKQEAQALIHAHPKNEILSKTIGYAEWMEFGFDNEKLVVSEIQKNTRNFAKRQLTWFRREEDVEWVSEAAAD